MEKGHQGYIHSIKAKNRNYGIIGIGLMFAIYFAGLIINGHNGSAFTLVAVLIALPAAQFLARYLSLRQFGSVSDDMVRVLDKAVPGTVIYEIALVLGKRTFFIDAAVVEDESLFVCTRDSKLKAKELTDFLAQKGIYVNVRLYNDPDLLAKDLKGTEVHDYHHLGHVKKALLENAL